MLSYPLLYIHLYESVYVTVPLFKYLIFVAGHHMYPFSVFHNISLDLGNNIYFCLCYVVFMFCLINVVFLICL